jgi:two-component system, chemotaxis family, response regulator Rcp1
MVDPEKDAFNILLVEDTPGDVRLITEGFKRTGLEPQFQVVSDGEEALIRLNRAGALLPDLILLDLNLPLLSGHEVLKQIKNDEILQKIPLVILTSSLLDEDMAKAKANQADFYVIKPINLDEYFRSISKIAGFWRDFKDSKKEI